MKTYFRGMAALLVLMLALALPGCGATLADAAKLSEYEIGDETAPSISSVVGERQVTGVNTETNNGVVSVQYTYKSDSVTDDLIAYLSRLSEDGWLVTQDYDLTVAPGTAQLGKASSEEGKILILSVAYEDGVYAVKLSKLDGTIEQN
jgi:hypothetical protein